MPDVQRIVNARAQMQARLGGGAAAGGGLLATLAALAQAVPSVPGASVQSLGWRDGALDLRLRVPAGEDLAMLSQSLGQRGVAVDVVSTTSQGETVEGKLQLRVPAG
jgi:type II secretory pathway component PulL